MLKQLIFNDLKNKDFNMENVSVDFIRFLTLLVPIMAHKTN